MLQLASAEYIEQEAANDDAIEHLPNHWDRIHGSLIARFCNLGEFLKVFQPRLQSEVLRRLEQRQETTSREFLSRALDAIADPVSGTLINPPVFSISTASRPKVLQPSMIANALRKRATSLAAEGQWSLAILSYQKSLAHGQRQPDLSFSTSLKSHDIPNIMAKTAQRFGLKEDYSVPEFWAWTSTIYPNILPASRTEIMETLFIKTWIGFDDALDLFGVRLFQYASPKVWKSVFWWLCRSQSIPKVDIDGRTGLHLAVLLGMKDEITLMSRTSNFDLSKKDKSGRTPLHVAAIIGNKSVCDTLLSVEHVGDAVLAKDVEGRLPLWYAAEANKREVFSKFLDTTLIHTSLTEICSDIDKDGNNLVQYCTAHGLAGSELWRLAAFSGFPDRTSLCPNPFEAQDESW